MECLPLISVVIPTYNRPVYLKRCIESVINQTYKNVEIIVVDDNDSNSEERVLTERVMKDFSCNSNIVYVQHEKNKNGSAARNTGLRHSKGEYITFIDDDDEIDSKKIEKQFQCLHNLGNEWGACYTGYVIITDNGISQKSAERRSGNCYIAALMRTMYLGSGSNLFLRKKIVDRIGGYDESFERNQDVEFLVRVLELCKIAYVDDCLLTIYQQGNRPKKSFEQIDGYAKYYLQKFMPRIEKLNLEDQKRVIAVISLERCRVAFCHRKFSAGFKILRENKVCLSYRWKYIKYLVNRVITHNSYGFDGNDNKS